MCMYVCVCVCVYVCVYVCLHSSMCVWVFTYVCDCVFTCVCLYMAGNAIEKLEVQTSQAHTLSENMLYNWLQFGEDHLVRVETERPAPCEL
jgi:hypothetical protein